MYEPTVNDLGGKKKLLEAVALVEEQLVAQKIRIIRFDLISPFHFVSGKERRYVIVRTLTEMESPNGTVRSQGFQFGVEVAPGKWQFLDGARTTPEIVSKYFQDFPPTEKLPERKQEVIPKKG